tara:strand:- start:4235 stop:4933 length:699 start_codon:yes stop_codon:yes gene_type:complete
MITGSSSGIGKAIAIKALEDGHRISLGLRSPEIVKGTDLDPSFHGKKKIIVHHYDALDRNSINLWIKNTHEDFGNINTLIHCAGTFKNTELLFKDNEYKDIEELWKVNLMGPWLLTRSIWKDLVADGNGRIQVLVSMSGKRSKSNLAAYTTSKFGLMGLCQTIRNEGWNKGIRITAICPGWVNTNMSANVKSIEKKEMTQPKDIASISSMLMKLPKSSIPFEVPINCVLEKI